MPSHPNALSDRTPLRGVEYPNGEAMMASSRSPQIMATPPSRFCPALRGRPPGSVTSTESSGRGRRLRSIARRRRNAAIPDLFIG